MSIGKEVEYVSECCGFGLVYLRIRASQARNSDELFVLNIEDLCKSATCRTKPVSLELVVCTFWAFPIVVMHSLWPLLWVMV